MFFERLKDSNDDSNTNLGYGYFVDQDQNPTINKPLLFVRTTTPTSTASIQMYNGGGVGTPAEITSYNRPSNFQQGTSSVALAVDSAETSSVTFSYIDTNYATQTTTVASGGTDTVTAITNSVVITSDYDDIDNITITYTNTTDSQTIIFYYS